MSDDYYSATMLAMKNITSLCKMKRTASKLALVVIAAITPLMLSGCASYQQASGPIEPPPDGYEAVRFKRPVSVRDHAVNILTFTTGSTFVADRKFQYGTVYCGNTLVNDSLSPVPECIALEGDRTLVLRPNSIYTVRREIPADSIERFRIK